MTREALLSRERCLLFGCHFRMDEQVCFLIHEGDGLNLADAWFLSQCLDHTQADEFAHLPHTSWQHQRLLNIEAEKQIKDVAPLSRADQHLDSLSELQFANDGREITLSLAPMCNLQVTIDQCEGATVRVGRRVIYWPLRLLHLCQGIRIVLLGLLQSVGFRVC